MNNLRGSVLTLFAAILMANVASMASAQAPPAGVAGAMPLPSPVAGPAFASAPIGPGNPQGIIMPPPQAMAQFQNAAIASQTPLAVAQIPAPQAMYNMPMAPGYGAPAYGPAAYGQAGYGPGIAPQPNWGVQPASYGTPQPFPSMQGMAAPAGYEMGPGYGGGGYAGGCASCGGHGCAACSASHAPGFFDRLINSLLPYAEGGQCAPRWYDITLDGLYLSRDNAGRNTDFTSDGLGGANIVLKTDDLNFNEELGFRFTGAHQIFAGATAEFTYFGLFNWTADASVTRDPANFPPIPPPPAAPPFADDLFSVLSIFGTDPFGGFDETDRSRHQSLRYSSTIDNFELNFRKRFTAPNCRLQYSWLAGVRYLYLLEDFEYFTLGGGDPSRGQMDYDVKARNSLTGFQVGGDGWLNLTPGVNVGADIKAGVYGNYADQTTNILSTDSAGGTINFNEQVHANDLALIADANLYFMWRLGPNWSVRAGYNFLYMDGVALGSENFNTAPPNILTGGASTQTRVSTINDNGNVFYHGGFGGIEWMW